MAVASNTGHVFYWRSIVAIALAALIIYVVASWYDVLFSYYTASFPSPAACSPDLQQPPHGLLPVINPTPDPFVKLQFALIWTLGVLLLLVAVKVIGEQVLAKQRQRQQESSSSTDVFDLSYAMPINREVLRLLLLREENQANSKAA